MSEASSESWVRGMFPFVVMCFGGFMALLDIQIVASSLQNIGGGLSAAQDEIGELDNYQKHKAAFKDAHANVAAASGQAIETGEPGAKERRGRYAELNKFRKFASKPVPVQNFQRIQHGNGGKPGSEAAEMGSPIDVWHLRRKHDIRRDRHQEKLCGKRKLSQKRQA